MKQHRVCVVLMFISVLAFSASAQQPKPGVLGAEDLKKLVPEVYFFRGQSATVQVRNSGGVATPDGKFVLASLVDTSGYASDIQAKYQGLLITEVKLNVGGSELAPGEYGFGFLKDGKFLVMDVGGHELLSVATTTDEKLAHPVPLKIVQDGSGYRLYDGRKWVSLKPE
jgi:hypothetical protein